MNNEKMNGCEIIKLIDILIGPVEAYGDTRIDESVMTNMKTLIDITNWCMDRLEQSSHSRHRFEKSMRDIGEMAFSALLEYQEWIQDRTMEET